MLFTTEYSGKKAHSKGRCYTTAGLSMLGDPAENDCRIVDFHGAQIASFTIRGRRMLCLPQATEHFLKDLVGGPHTVYCKCKRLEIYPIPCNVDQVWES